MKEFDPRLGGSFFYAPEKDTGSLSNPAPEDKKSGDIPTVLRDKRGRVVWKVKGNTQEQNEVIGIKNVQGLFLAKFPEFNKLFPRDEFGQIIEEKREKAKQFIVDNIGTNKKFVNIISNSAMSRYVAPYFEGSATIIFKKVFSRWGLIFVDPTNTSIDIPTALHDKRERIVLSTSLQEELKPLGLIKRLDRVLQEYPNKYGQDTVLRVRTVIYHEFDKKRPPYLFQTISDFQLYYLLHLEWQSMSTTDMLYNKQFGASKFYSAFNRWLKTISQGDSKIRRELLEQIFPIRRANYSSINTIDDWIAKFQTHPEWQGRTPKEMQNDVKSGASAFYNYFTRWARKEANEDEQERSRLVGQLFNSQLINRSHLTSMEDWCSEFQRHPEWQGRTPIGMQKDKESGANAFYNAFIKWLRKTAKTDKEKEKYIKMIFPNTRIFRMDRQKSSTFTTIEDWLVEFQAHPEWQRRIPREMDDDIKTGAHAFYYSFNAWLRKTCKVDEEREKYVRIIFPNARQHTRKTKEHKEQISPQEAKEELDKFFENP